jgi:hypothetical protein
MLYRQWRRFLAFWRLNLNAVCEMSDSEHEYHDYPDDEQGQPWHFIALTCKRCSREFYI